MSACIFNFLASVLTRHEAASCSLRCAWPIHLRLTEPHLTRRQTRGLYIPCSHLLTRSPFFSYTIFLCLFAVTFRTYCSNMNLTACGDKFTSGIYPNYTYNGTIRGILKHVEPKPPLITVQGCHDLCGEGSDYYSWNDVSSTITTWVRVLLLQVQSTTYKEGTAHHRPHSTGPLRKQPELQQLLSACALDWQPNREHLLRLVEHQNHRQMCYDGGYGYTI